MGRATAGLIAWPRPILLCARRGQRPELPCLAACARTRRIWRCSSSFAAAGRSTRADRPALLERNRYGCTGAPSRAAAGPEKGAEERGRTQHDPKTDVVVAIAGMIPGAVGTARVVMVIVPRAAAHDLSRPPDRMSPPGKQMIAQKKFESRGKFPPYPLRRPRVRVPECGAPENRAKQQGENATRPENRCSSSDRRDDPCCGRHSARGQG